MSVQTVRLIVVLISCVSELPNKWKPIVSYLLSKLMAMKNMYDGWINCLIVVCINFQCVMSYIFAALHSVIFYSLVWLWLLIWKHHLHLVVASYFPQEPRKREEHKLVEWMSSFKRPKGFPSLTHHRENGNVKSQKLSQKLGNPIRTFKFGGSSWCNKFL